MKKPRKLFPIDRKRLLPKDIELFERLEKEENSETEKDFEKMLDLVAQTPPVKLKPSKVSRKRSGQAKAQT